MKEGEQLNSRKSGMQVSFNLGVSKRDPKYMTKNQLIDTYIDGDLELVEFMEHIQPKFQKKGHTGWRKNDHSNNKRISEIFANPNNKSRLRDEEKPANKSLIVSLGDYLEDLNE